MNKKYERYIDYIVNDLEAPYFFNMENQYGLRPDEYKLVLSKLYNQPVTIIGRYVYDNQENKLYFERSNGYWQKYEYDNQRNNIYYENSYGFWKKGEYDEQGKIIYYEDSNGHIEDNRR
jgi:hypothetical protein